MDSLAEKYPGISPYSYCAGNPVNFVDHDGNFPETLWDIANVVMDVKSLASNLRQGKIAASIVDGVSLAFDAAAVVLPFVPGGVGSLVKAERGVGKTAGIVENAADAAKSSGNAALRESATVGQEAHRQIEKAFLDTGDALKKEVVVDLPNNTKVRKDALLKDGSYLIIKPDTPSGHYSATKREGLMHHMDIKQKPSFMIQRTLHINLAHQHI